MSTAAPCASSLYRIVPDDDEHGQRIVAVTADTGIEIAGAYRPHGLNDWRIYLTKLVPERTGLPQAHKVHCCSRDDAVSWVDTIAWLYVHTSAMAVAS